MEMTYGGELVMPSSYSMMDEEEMMYLEGGAYWIDLNVRQVETLVNEYLGFLIDPKSIFLTVAEYISKANQNSFYNLVKLCQKASGWDLFNNINGLISQVFNVSVGLGIALIFDACDDTGTNLRVQYSSCNPWIYSN